VVPFCDVPQGSLPTSEVSNLIRLPAADSAVDVDREPNIGRNTVSGDCNDTLGYEDAKSGVQSTEFMVKNPGS
jgi:hypothetical protein